MSTASLLLQVAKMNSHLNWSREQIIAYQDKMFRRLLHHAYDNRPFYRKFYTSQGIKKKDLDEIPPEQLPPIDKDTVMENFSGISPEGIQLSEIEKFLSQRAGPLKLLRKKYHVIHTSGSTGKIGYFIYGPGEWRTVKALALRIFPSFSLLPRRYAYIGAVDGNYAGISLFLSPQSGGLLERSIYRPLPVNVNWPVSRWVKNLNCYQPQVLCGYHAAIGILANEQAAGRLQISPQAIVCGGEPLTSKLKSAFKSAFGVVPINYYATSESLVLGVKHPGTPYFYLFDDVNYFEQAKDNEGYLLTNLYNYTFPLIRYRVADQLLLEEEQFSGSQPSGIWSSGSRSSGSQSSSSRPPSSLPSKPWPFLRAREIAGRAEDLLWLKRDDATWEFIHPIVFVEFYSPGLKQFQVVRRHPRCLCLRAVFDRPGNEKLHHLARQRLQQILQSKGLSEIDIQIEEQQVIQPDPATGKTPLIIH